MEAIEILRRTISTKAEIQQTDTEKKIRTVGSRTNSMFKSRYRPRPPEMGGLCQHPSQTDPPRSSPSMVAAFDGFGRTKTLQTKFNRPVEILIIS